MHKLISLWNQNRKLFLAIIGIIIAIFTGIQLLNQMAKNDLKEKNNGNSGTAISPNNTVIDKSANTTQTDSIGSNTNISAETANANQTIIKNFVDYCNNGNITEAYKLLTDKCKAEFYTTQNDFKSKYVDRIFTSKKQFNLQNWYTSDLGSTYKITYINDILASGKVETNIEDYITVSNNKININRFIDKLDVNRTSSNKFAKITLVSREIFDEYEIFNLQVTNLTNTTIMINRHADNGKTYATYNDSKTYKAIISETYSGNLTIEGNQTKNVSIKINKMYNGNYSLSKLTFTDIINNKNDFDKITNKDAYTNVSSIEINL